MVSPVRGHHRRFQAETPLIALCRFAGPALPTSRPYWSRRGAKDGRVSALRVRQGWEGLFALRLRKASQVTPKGNVTGYVTGCGRLRNRYGVSPQTRNKQARNASGSESGPAVSTDAGDASARDRGSQAS